MILVKYKVISTGKEKKVPYDHLQSMIIVDRRCPNRSIVVSDPNYQEKNGLLIKKVESKRAGNKGKTDQSEERPLID